MCQIGDILLIYNSKSNGKFVGQHPFIVLDDRNDIVNGVYAYDFIGLIMTSANTPEKKERLSKIEGNFPISPDDKIMAEGKDKDNRYAYAEVDQFFYFAKSKIKYLHIGRMDGEAFNLIIEFIQELIDDGKSFNQIIDNSKEIEESAWFVSILFIICCMIKYKNRTHISIGSIR